MSASDARGDGAQPPAEEAAQAGGGVVFTGVLLAVVLAFVAQALPLPMLAPDGSIGPGLFPMVVSGLVAAGLAVHLARGLRARARGGTAGTPSVVAGQLGLLGLIVLAMVLGLWVGLIGIVAVLLLTGLLLIDRVTPARAVLFTAGTLVIVYLIFDLGLRMDIGLRGLL